MPAMRLTAALCGFLAAGIVATAIPATAAPMPPETAQLVARVMPSVVNITIVPGEHEAGSREVAGPDLSKHKPQKMIGSGFVVSSDGLIATNKHVVDGAERILVRLNDGTILRAWIVGEAVAADIALIRVKPPSPLQVAETGENSTVMIGEPVLAIGNPLGFSGSVTAGVVSALNRDIRSSPFDDFIQTDAAINHGSSGGPLFDLQGRVIGMNTALESPTAEGGSIGIGFSMPVADVMFVVRSIREYGHVRAGWIGAKMQPLTPLLAKALQLPNTDGAIVSDVGRSTPAESAGLKRGDVILEFAGQPVADVRALMRAAGRTLPGTVVTITDWRDGALQKVDVTLGQFPGEAKPAGKQRRPAEDPDATPNYGLTLAPLNTALRNRYKVGPGVAGVAVIKIDGDGQAADTDLAVGDVIVEVERQAVSTPKAALDVLNRAKADGRQAAILLVRHEKEYRWMGLHLRGVR